MKRLILIASLAAQMAAASGPADFAQVIPIETTGESTAWQVELDDSVYQASVDPDLRDMAIFNADGRAVPMKIWPIESADTVIEQRADVPVLALPSTVREAEEGDLHLIVERDAAGRLRRLETQASTESVAAPDTREWLLDLAGFDRGIEFLELHWDEPSNDVIARFDVNESDNLQHWNLLNAGATLVVLQKDGARIERRHIDLPTTRHRYLRLRRTDDGVALRGLRATASKIRQLAGVPRTQWIEAESVDEIAGLVASNTQYLYSLPFAAPVTQAKITLASDNSLAQLEVLTPPTDGPGSKPWSRRARLVAFNLREGNEVIEADRILLSNGQPRVASLRIDSVTPLASPPHVSVGFRPTRLLFLAEGRGPFELAVGSATAKHADYPIEAALASLRTRLGKEWQPPSAKLGEPRISAGTNALRPPEQPTDWKRWLLWAVLILAAIIVGSFALILLRGNSQRGAVDGQQPPEE